MENNVTSRQVFERYLTDAEVKQLLGTIEKTTGDLARRDHAWMSLMLATGIRVGSMSKLTVEDAKEAIETHRLRVRPEAAKGGHGYQVHATTKAVAALRVLLKVRKDMAPVPVGNALILARTGNPMSVRSYQQRMSEWVQLAKLREPASPHWLRHTLAKRVIARSEAADPMAIAQLALGHRNRKTTSVYTLPDREQVAKAMENAS